MLAQCFGMPAGLVCGGLDREMRKLPPSNGLPLVNTLPFTYVSASPIIAHSSFVHFLILFLPFTIPPQSECVFLFLARISFLPWCSLVRLYVMPLPRISATLPPRIPGTSQECAVIAKLIISRFDRFVGFEPHSADKVIPALK